ncbi:MAG: NAD-glutamate dehydrogenase, partial [Alphaproteobacteria bacterium]|nr:NAD-glutamate dehydrogenase [Alphaproteobacteria bacterium]
MLDTSVRGVKDSRLEEVSRMLGKHFKSSEAAEIKAFVEQFYARISHEDINDTSPENLYGAALSLWKFAAQRAVGETKLRVYNPATEEHGWKSSHTIVEIITDDSPFIVDSITGNLNHWDCQVHLAIHPVVRLRRDGEGRRVELLPPLANGKTGLSEAVMHIQIAEQSDRGVLEKIAEGLRGVLADVKVAVADWPAMKLQLDEAIAHMATSTLPQSKEEVAEANAFLAWIRDNHFTFLGSRDYSYSSGDGDNLPNIVPGTSLGLFRDEARSVLTRQGDGQSAAAACWDRLAAVASYGRR